MDTLVDEVEVPDRPSVLHSSLGFEITTTTIDWSKPLPAWTDVPAPPEAP